MPETPLDRLRAALPSGVWPPVPDEVRDDMARLRYTTLIDQVPLLYATTMVVVVICAIATDPAIGAWLRWGLPVVVVAGGSLRLRWWLKRRAESPTPAEARRRINRVTIYAGALAAVCSIWTAIGWTHRAMDDISYYPMFMALGALSAAFCLSTHRAAAHVLLVMGITPVIGTLLVAGGAIDRTAAILIAISAIFLMRLISQRHAQLVMMLGLQQQTQRLADTDPLTGLANRRCLFARFERELNAVAPPGIILIDLDGFKAVNDTHGHNVGDGLLCEVALRLLALAADHAPALAARLGGDEFAILIPEADTATLDMLTARLRARIAMPLTIDGRTLRIGASIGTALADQDAASVAALLERADARLYSAKDRTKRSVPTPVRRLALADAA